MLVKLQTVTKILDLRGKSEIKENEFNTVVYGY